MKYDTGTTMPHFEFVWIASNIEHLAENGLTTDDAEHAMTNPISPFESASSGRAGFRGRALDGRPIVVIYEQYDELTVYVVTAYYVDRRWD